MNVRTVLGLTLAVAALLIPGSAFAQGPGACDCPCAGQGMNFAAHRPPLEHAFHGHGIMGRWWNNPNIASRLNLTDAQKKEFDSILLQHRESLIDLRANVEKAELELAPLIHDEQPNESKILAQIDKVAQARAELEKANARYLLAIRGKLTPEQWKAVQRFRAERQAGRAWGRGPGGMGGPPPAPPAAGPVQ